MINGLQFCFNFGFKFNLRRYNTVPRRACGGSGGDSGGKSDPLGTAVCSALAELDPAASEVMLVAVSAEVTDIDALRSLLARGVARLGYGPVTSDGLLVVHSHPFACYSTVCSWCSFRHSPLPSSAPHAPLPLVHWYTMSKHLG
jgi:hypothetical protein